MGFSQRAIIARHELYSLLILATHQPVERVAQVAERGHPDDTLVVGVHREALRSGWHSNRVSAL